MILTPSKKRVNEILLQYLNKLRGDRPFPFENEINPEAIASIWDHCFMVRHEPDAEEQLFRYIYLGQSLVEAYGEEGSSKEVCQKLAYPPTNELNQKFLEVVTTQAPTMQESEFTNSKGLIIKYRSCLLPLAKEQADEVGYVIGAMKWKAH